MAEELLNIIWGDGSYSLTDAIMCSGDEEYREEPLSEGYFKYSISVNPPGVEEMTITEVTCNSDLHAGYIAPTNGLIRFDNGVIIKAVSSVDGHEVLSSIIPMYWFSPGNNREGEFATNIPIFETETEYNYYLDTSHSKAERLAYLEEHALNYSSGETSPEGRFFELQVQWTTSTWTSDRQPAVVSQPNLQGLRGKIISGEFALYTIKGISDNKLKYGIKSNATFFDLEYMDASGNWQTTQTIPYDFIYRQRKNELGTFSYALSFGTQNVPHFKNEDDAQDFIDGDLPISEAENWDQISPNYPGVPVPGTPVTQTEFGEVGARSIFSQQYVVPLAVLYEIANTFYDTDRAGLWDDIKKGLQMYGDSPIECIENLSFYACDLDSIFPGASQNYIYFGGYQMNLSQGSVYKIANPDGSIDVGSTFFRRPRKNFMDFEPYCSLSVDLPYCGTYQLDLSQYYDKTLSVKYFIDTRTGSCCAVLMADNIMIDKFNGQIGVQMPIKLTDFSAYANAQINTLLGGGGQALSGGVNSVGNVINAAGAGSGAVGAAAVAGAAGLGAGLLGVTGAKTMYGIAQNNISKFAKTKGGSTSMLNMYLPQRVCFTFEMYEPDIPSNFYSLNGYPSNAGGYIGNFSGFLKCDSVKLSMPGATDAELEKAKALLLSGVYL